MLNKVIVQLTWPWGHWWKRWCKWWSGVAPHFQPRLFLVYFSWQMRPSISGLTFLAVLSSLFSLFTPMLWRSQASMEVMLIMWCSHVFCFSTRFVIGQFPLWHHQDTWCGIRTKDNIRIKSFLLLDIKIV